MPPDLRSGGHKKTISGDFERFSSANHALALKYFKISLGTFLLRMAHIILK
jgi:hypothetical protein